MCGIVAYIGNKQALPILIEGLSALEYRGYDSAGVALCCSKGLAIHKDKGKVDNLRAITDSCRSTANCGIAHTRWATHGAPSQTNSHPHSDCNGRIALVHNGIIENYSILKQKLVKEGVKFSSETDSEVLAQLVGKYYTGEDLAAAVRRALSEVEGTFGIAVVAKDNPGVLVGARRGSPLVVGVGENELLLPVMHPQSCAIPRMSSILRITI